MVAIVKLLSNHHAENYIPLTYWYTPILHVCTLASISERFTSEGDELPRFAVVQSVDETKGDVTKRLSNVRILQCSN
jgi:hypothetical protein